MNDNHYAALTHILLSDTYTSDGNYAMYGCTEQFKDVGAVRTCSASGTRAR